MFSHKVLTISSSPPLRDESIPFRLRVFNQRHLQLRPTPIGSTIRDFHPYFYIQFF